MVAYAERRGLHPLAPASEIVATPPEERPAPLLAAYRDPWGRDSLGRGTTAGEVTAAVAQDPIVQHAERHLTIWIDHAYRDPAEAQRRLHALEAAEGGPQGAEHALRHGGPELLGELRGKVGWFASAAAKAERDAAVRCAGSIGPGLVQLREAEDRAGGAYARSVEAQRVRDAVEVPGLSAEAWAAVRAVEAAARQGTEGRPTVTRGAEYWARQAGMEEQVGTAWAREIGLRPAVAAELAAVTAAAERRFGGAELARLWRGGRELQTGEESLARVVGVESRGRSAFVERGRAAERQQEAQQKRLGLRQGRGMRM